MQHCVNVCLQTNRVAGHERKDPAVVVNASAGLLAVSCRYLHRNVHRKQLRTGNKQNIFSIVLYALDSLFLFISSLYLSSLPLSLCLSLLLPSPLSKSLCHLDLICLDCVSCVISGASEVCVGLSVSVTIMKPKKVIKMHTKKKQKQHQQQQQNEANEIANKTVHRVEKKLCTNLNGDETR